MDSVPIRTRDPHTPRHVIHRSLALTRSVKRQFRFWLSFDTFIRSMNVMMMAALVLQFTVISVYTATSALQRKPASYAYYTDNVRYHGDDPDQPKLGEPRTAGYIPTDAYPLSLSKMDKQARVTVAFKTSSKRTPDSKKMPLDTHAFHDIHKVFQASGTGSVFISSNNTTAADRTKKTRARIPVQHSGWDRDRLADVSPTPQTFQSIDGQEAWLYSAYYDNLSTPGRPLVRLFGLIKKSLLVTVYCHYHHNLSDHKTIISTGISKPLPESHNMGYKPCYIECSLPTRLHPKSVSVSFQSNSTALPTNQLPVAYPGPKRWNITVCYSVLHTNFSQVSQLIQSIEANRVLGAEHFVLYNHSIASGVAQVLYQYQREGLVTVLSWPMPNVSTWYFAQMTALNDCFYRYRKRTDLIVVEDMDELIIPHKHSTWLELIETLDNFNQSSLPSTSNRLDMRTISSPLKRSTRVGAYQFRSTIFWSEASKNQEDIARLREHFTPEEQEEIQRYNIHLFSHTRHSWRIFSHKHRSKFIARPETVLITGIHYVQNFTNVDIRSINVSMDLGLVHHYRNLSHQADTIMMEDTTIHRYKQRLYPRLLKKFQMFQDLFL